MMGTLRTLFSPLNYLRAKNPHKLVWDWIIPALLACVGVSGLLFLPRPISVLGDKGLIYWVNELLQVLVGFYIAALAAIASFNRVSLDQEIEGDGIILKVWRESKKVDKRLTRRAFLSLMFGYLSLLSIFLYCSGLGAFVLTENVRLISSQVLPYLRGVFVFMYGFFFSQMLIITLVALYYLSDRIHRQTPIPLPPVDAAEDESAD